jgi:hypothetical protein
MAIVSFKVSKEVNAAIALVVARYLEIYERLNGRSLDRMSLNMDLTATEANGCPMDWEILLAADEFTFCHDVGGIRRHINRETGQLEDFFLPRCHAKGVMQHD